MHCYRRYKKTEIALETDEMSKVPNVKYSRKALPAILGARLAVWSSRLYIKHRLHCMLYIDNKKQATHPKFNVLHPHNNTSKFMRDKCVQGKCRETELWPELINVKVFWESRRPIFEGPYSCIDRNIHQQLPDRRWRTCPSLFLTLFASRMY